MNNSLNLSRKETIENLRAQLAGLYAGGCDVDNSPDVAALQSAVRLLRTDERSERDEVAEKLYLFGLLFLSAGYIGLVLAAVSALFVWGGAGAVAGISVLSAAVGVGLLLTALR